MRLATDWEESVLLSAVVNVPVNFEDGGVVDQVVFRVYVGSPHRGRAQPRRLYEQ